jgi:hypothetical protein
VKYYKKEDDGETFVLSIDEGDNNYSIASNLDPEPEGFIDHHWGEDAEEWQEITKEDAEKILGWDFYSGLPNKYYNEFSQNYKP